MISKKQKIKYLSLITLPIFSFTIFPLVSCSQQENKQIIEKKNLIQNEIDRVNQLDTNKYSKSIFQYQFDSINQDNLLKQFDFGLNKDFLYQVTDFVKNNNSISFKLNISILGFENLQKQTNDIKISLNVFPNEPNINTNVNKQIQSIADITTRLYVEVYNFQNQHQRHDIVGTAWVFDKLLPKDNDEYLTYYLATNSHVIQWTEKMGLRLPANLLKYDDPSLKFDSNGLLDIESYYKEYQRRLMTENNSQQNFPRGYIRASNEIYAHDDYNVDIINKTTNNQNEFLFDFYKWIRISQNNFDISLRNDVDLGIVELKLKRGQPLPWFIQTWEYMYNKPSQKIYPYINTNISSNDFITTAGYTSSSWNTIDSKILGIDNNYPGYNYFFGPYHNAKRYTAKVDSVGLGSGASGSCVMNKNNQIVGIYWGRHSDSKALFDPFFENQVISNWLIYLKSKKLNTFINSFLQEEV